MFSGDFHIPRAEAIKIVGDVIKSFEKTHPKLEIFLVLYKQNIYDMAVNLLSE